MVLSVFGTAASNTLVLVGRMTAANLAARGHGGGQTGLGTALAHGRLAEAKGILAETASEVQSRMDSDKNVLEVLRQPLEDGSVTIARAAMSLSFPARFMLAAAMNP